MDCHNKTCQYYNPQYVGNCWDIGEVDDCEDALTEEGYKAEQVELLASYLNMTKWENKSLKVLEAVRKAYVEAHGEGE